MPPLPSKPEIPEPPQRSCLSLGLAALFVSFMVLILLFLTLGSFGPVLIVGGGIFLFAAIQYLIWGRLMTRLLKQQSDNDDQSADY